MKKTKIVKEVPKIKGRGKTRYHFEEFKLKENRFFPFKEGKNPNNLNKQILKCAKFFIDNHEPTWKFTTRTDEVKGVKGIMVYRVK